jgi:serine/threonine-protein kinase
VLRLLRRCLRRDARERLRDLGDAALELQELDQDEGPGTRRGASVSRARRMARTGGRRGLRGGCPRLLPPRGPSRGGGAHAAQPGAAARHRAGDDYTAPFDLSADGTRLVLLTLEGASTHLFVRRLDAVALQPVPEADGAWQPALSPDGSEVAYFTARALKRAALDGSPAVTLAETTANQRGAAWLPDGSIVYSPSQSSGLARVARGGGGGVPLTSLDLAAGEGSHRWPHALPGGRFVLFTCGFEGAPFDEAAIDAVAVATGERRRLLENARTRGMRPDGSSSCAAAACWRRPSTRARSRCAAGGGGGGRRALRPAQRRRALRGGRPTGRSCTDRVRRCPRTRTCRGWTPPAASRASRTRRARSATRGSARTDGASRRASAAGPVPTSGSSTPTAAR